MKKTGKKPVIGIMGGIGSGKSAVAAEFARLGCAVIDADEIAHKLLDSKKIIEKITAIFGTDIINTENRIDRKKLAEIVFSDQAKLSLLNEVIHPPVLRKIRMLISKYNKQNNIKAIVLDIPLLAEVGWTDLCSRLIFIKSLKKNRLHRLKQRGINENQLKKREFFQISLDKKCKLADNIIENNSDFSALVRQVDNIFSDIIG